MSIRWLKVRAAAWYYLRARNGRSLPVELGRALSSRQRRPARAPQLAWRHVEPGAAAVLRPDGQLSLRSRLHRAEPRDLRAAACDRRRKLGEPAGAHADARSGADFGITITPARPREGGDPAKACARASVTRRPPGDLFPSPGQFGRGSPVFLKNNPVQSKWNKVSGIRRGEEAVAPPHGRRSPFERFDPCLAKAKKPSGATTPQAESAAHLIFWISSRDSLIRSRTRRYSARASRV